MTSSVWLSSVLLLVIAGCSVVTCSQLWESDESDYQEVMKNLEEERAQESKKSTADSEALEEQEETKKGNVEYLSTYLVTNYQTWISSGESTTNGKSNAWTSTYISSWVNSYVKTFHANENAPGYTSESVSYSSRIVTLQPTMVIVRQPRKDMNTGEGWPSAFKVEDCKQRFVDADKWLAGQLKQWAAAVKPLQHKVQKWFARNKRIGSWWLQEANDDRYEQWQKWVHYLESQRANHLAKGGKKFTPISQKQTRTVLKSMLAKLRNRLTKRIKEGRRIVQFKTIPHFTYKSPVLHHFATASANLWRRSELSKFGAVYLRLYKAAQSLYQTQRPDVKKLWKTFEGIYLSFYKDFVNMMKPYYENIVKTTNESDIKLLRKKWKLFIQPFFYKLEAFHRSVVRRVPKQMKFAKPGGVIVKPAVKPKLIHRKNLLHKLKKLKKIALKMGSIPARTANLLSANLGKRVLSKFNKAVCGCDKRSLSANEWVARQLKYWQRAVERIRLDIQSWYKRHLSVGRWWIIQINDEIHGLWIQWTRYLDHLRSLRIKLGAIKFHEQFTDQIDNKLLTLLTQLRDRLAAHFRRGRQVLKSLKKPALKTKLTAILNYKPQHKKVARLISVKLWQRREDAKFKAVISRMRQSAKNWNKKSNLKTKWWLKLHNRLMNVAYKQFKDLQKIYSGEIHRRGYVWYKKQGRVDWTNVVKQLYSKLRPLNKTIFAKSQAITRRKTRRIPAAIKSKVITAVKTLMGGLQLLGSRLKRKLERSIHRSLYAHLVVVEKPKNKKQSKWSLTARPPLPHKFVIQKCDCDPVTISSNDWLARQLTRWDSAISSLRRKVYQWYSRNKAIGRWWLDECKDDIYELWIKWVWYLDNLRKMRILLGAQQFEKSFGAQLRLKLRASVKDLKKRFAAQVIDGRNANKWKSHRAFKDKLALLKEYRPIYKKTYRLMSANIWMRQELARFGALVSELHQSGQAWYKRHASSNKSWWRSYRRLIDLIYRRFSRFLVIYIRGIRRHGYIWHVQVGGPRWREMRQGLEKKVQTIHKVLLTKSSSLLARIRTLSRKAACVLLRTEFSHHFRHFNRFASKLKTGIRRLVDKEWTIRILESPRKRKMLK